MKKFWLMIGLCLLFILTVNAQTLNDNHQKKDSNTISKKNYPAKHEAILGVYVTEIYNIDFHNASFDCVFWVWSTSRDKNYQIGKSLDVVNAIKIKKKELIKNEIEPGLYESYAQIFATIHNNWDYSSFPYDAFNLKIKLEDSDYESHELRFIPQKQKVVVDPNIQIAGWKVSDGTLTSSTRLYKTGFSALTDASRYSNVMVTIPIHRIGHRFFLKITSMLYLAFILCICTYLIPIRHFQSRITLLLGAIFVEVGIIIVHNSILPDVNDILFSDKISLATLIALVITLLSVLLTDQLLTFKRKRLATILNTLIGAAVLATYIIFNFYELSKLLH